MRHLEHTETFRGKLFYQREDFKKSYSIDRNRTSKMYKSIFIDGWMPAKKLNHEVAQNTSQSRSKA